MNGKEEKAGMKDKAVKKATAKVREKAQKRTQARKGKKKGILGTPLFCRNQKLRGRTLVGKMT